MSSSSYIGEIKELRASSKIIEAKYGSKVMAANKIF